MTFPMASVIVHHYDLAMVDGYYGYSQSYSSSDFQIFQVMDLQSQGLRVVRDTTGQTRYLFTFSLLGFFPVYIYIDVFKYIIINDMYAFLIPQN